MSKLQLNLARNQALIVCLCLAKTSGQLRRDADLNRAISHNDQADELDAEARALDTALRQLRKQLGI